MQQFIDTLINGPARYSLANNFGPGWSLLFVITILLFEIGVVYILIKLLKHWKTIFSFILRHISIRVHDEKYTILELILPLETDKSIYATERLHTFLHNIHVPDEKLKRIAGYKQTYSTEIVSSHSNGIRYLIRTPNQNIDALKRTLLSFIPTLKISTTEDYTQHIPQLSWSIVEMALTNDFIFPLGNNTMPRQHDPIAFIVGHMRDLLPDELISFQIVSTPLLINTHPGAFRHMGNVQQNLKLHIDNSNKPTFHIFGAPFKLLSYFAKYKKKNLQDTKDTQLEESISTKLTQPLFEVSIRFLVASPDESHTHERVKALQSTFVQFATSNQSITSGVHRLYSSPKMRLEHFTKRTLTNHILTRKTILSSHELSSLYHFPVNRSDSDNILSSLSPTLTTPLSISNHSGYDVELGQSSHRDIHYSIGLTLKEREKHIFIIGGTGNGKTTLLEYSIIQDIQHGKGVALVDPHGDLAESLLHWIPNNRVNDVIYFNPDDLEYPIGLNLLELTPSLSEEDLLREKDLITESIISIFRKIFSDDDNGGHRVEYILRNTVHTALTVKDATLFTIYDLLNDPRYRRSVIKDLNDKNLKNFWRNEMGRAGGMQQVKMAAGITSKIGRFLFSASASRILGQAKSTINFDDILDGKILICNFSKGILGEDTSELFGIAILAKLQLSSLRRARLAQEDRKPYYLYVDEFQNFATPSFTQMLSESRKYKLFLVMAEQSTSQQSDRKMIDIILANVGTVICFRSGNPSDEDRLLPYFFPYLHKGDIVNLPPYNFYIRISATRVQEALSGETIVTPKSTNINTKTSVIKASRANFAKRFEEANPNEGSQTHTKKNKQTHSRHTLLEPE